MKKLKKTPEEKTGQLFMYSQQLKYMGQDGRISLDELDAVLSSNTEEYAYIIHDKDFNEDEMPAEPHFHLVFRIKWSRKLKDVMKWFGETRPSQFELPIEEIDDNKKNNRWNNMLSYLCHRTAKAKKKHQYDFSEVKANFDYPAAMQKIQEELDAKMEEINEAKRNAPYYIKWKEKKSGGWTPTVCRELIKDRIKELVMNGSLRMYNWADYLDDIEYEVGYGYMVKMLDYYDEKNRVYERLNLKAYYITGDSSTGKTNFANKCANAKYEPREICMINYQDPNCWDTYNGQPCLIIDDFKPKKGYFSEFLNLLDTSRNAELHARFKNRYFGNLECVYITSILGLGDLSFNSNSDEYDEKKEGRFFQLYRRIVGFYYLRHEGPADQFNTKFDYYYFDQNKTSQFPYTLMLTGLPVEYDETIAKASPEYVGFEEVSAITGICHEDILKFLPASKKDTSDKKVTTIYAVKPNEIKETETLKIGKISEEDDDDIFF